MIDNESFSEKIDIKSLRHKAEMPLHVISLLISLVIYAVVNYLAILAVGSPKASEIIVNLLGDEAELYEPLIKFGGLFVVLGCIVLYFSFIHKGIKNYGEAITRDIPVTEGQFPTLKNICETYSRKLGIKDVPELYISDEGIAAIEVSSLILKSMLYIRLNSYYVLTAAESEDYTELSFELGTELAHIALGHRSTIWVILTIPARILPIYRHLYARVLNYSADRVAAEFVGKDDAAKAIITLTHDPYLSQIVDKKTFISDITDSPDFMDKVSLIYYNLISDQSIPAFRISAILDDKNKNGRLI